MSDGTTLTTQSAQAAPTVAVLGPDGPRIVPAGQPVVVADDLGLLRGEAVFETARAAGCRAFVLDHHLARLARSAAAIGVALPAEEDLLELSRAALEEFGPDEASLRLVVTKGPAGAGAGTAVAVVTAADPGYPAVRASGVRAVTLTLGVPAALRPQAPWLLGGVKSTSYATAMAGLREAGARGAAEAVWVSSDGEVLEAPTANVLVVVDGEAFTPPPAEIGVLPGTTVAALGEGVTMRRIAVDVLRAADEVALASSVRGVVPVVALDGSPVGDGTVGPVVAALSDRLEQAFLAAVHGPA